eukprot:12598123-Ditylum_brightwellii.AAC.1
MGCASSAPEAPPNSGGGPTQSNFSQPGGGMAEANGSAGIDRELERAKNEEEGKVKLLLLGAGESGKSTIFKQMRILYGTPRTEEDLRMHGVVVRANVIVAVRKLCTHLRNLGLEPELDKEA